VTYLPSRRALPTALSPVLISSPAEGRRLSWPEWLVTYQDGIPISKLSSFVDVINAVGKTATVAVILA